MPRRSRAAVGGLLAEAGGRSFSAIVTDLQWSARITPRTRSGSVFDGLALLDEVADSA
jgi:hypothetical protein